MSEQNNEVYSAYTPLRNSLRQTNIESSLRAIHAYIQHMHFGNDLPNYIFNTPPGYRSLKGLKNYITSGLLPWELETLAKEAILHSENVVEKKTLENWNYLAPTVNKLKGLEGTIAKIYSNSDNVLIEIYRIAHRQFAWQRAPNLEDIARYWKIYSNEKLSKIIYNEFGLTVDDLYLLGFAFIGLYINKVALFYPPIINLKHISQEDLEKFLRHFSIPIIELKKMLKQEQEINEKYFYAYNSFKKFPLIQMSYENRDSIVCPIPTYLYRRLTEGLYYEVVNKDGFDEAYGEAFQSFVGEMLRLGNSSAKILPEAIYGKSKERTTDWMLVDSSAILFIECKGKRITLGAKTSLLDNEELKKQLDIMASFVVQIYKTMLDYQKGLYPNLKYDENKKVYPLVVTLEEWYLFGGKLFGYLNESVRTKLSNEKIDADILNTNPYTICSIDGLNSLVQVSQTIGINVILHKKYIDPETRDWAIETFINNNYPEEVLKMKSLFKNEFDKRIEDWIKLKRQ